MSHLYYCSVGTWENCSWHKTGPHGWPLKVHGELTLMTCMSISHGSKWRRDWLQSLLIFVWGVGKLNVCLIYLHTPRTPMHIPQDMPTEVSSMSRTDSGRHTVLHRAMTTWISIPHQVTDIDRYRHMHTHALWYCCMVVSSVLYCRYVVVY
jgi:hypothetical protein